MDVDTDSEPTLLDGQDRQRSNVNPSWSPDGETIIFSSLHSVLGEN
jgi:Tol biopolymer transport system component